MSNGKNTPVTPLTYKQCIDKYGAGAARCQALKPERKPNKPMNPMNPMKPMKRPSPIERM